LQGHINYFGVNGNCESVNRVVWEAERSWLKWLRRRSQRHRMNWERFKLLLKHYCLPKARIVVQIWG
jgi:RNA-directed DNA polymerase